MRDADHRFATKLVPESQYVRNYQTAGRVGIGPCRPPPRCATPLPLSYCDAGSPQIESAFGGFVHVVDGVEYECENPIRSQPPADH